MGSFRDPEGRLSLSLDGPLRRHLEGEGVARAAAIAALPPIQRFQAEGRWVRAEADAAASPGLLHPRVFFPSYPQEWCPSMLHRAASLTLEINLALLPLGWELKDATPANLLFEGTGPLFVDFLSPAPRAPHQLGWRAYGQFIRSFLIPLLLHRRLRLPLRWLYLAQRDGLSPEAALPLFGPLGRFHPAVFPLVSLPAWLATRGPQTASGLASTSSPELAIPISRRLLGGLGRRLARLAPPAPGPSAWSGYGEQETSYSAAKEAFVLEALERCGPATVLDLGCNTGRYSKLAARKGARVVALDGDPACIERLFLEAEAAALDIQPLVAELGRPSPRQGWGYREEYSLWDRLEGRFELVLALALLHHLLVRERVPLEEILAFLRRCTTRYLLLEWVPPEDPLFQHLAGPHQALYAGLSLADLRQGLEPHFRILAEAGLGDPGLPGPARTLLLLELR